MVMQGIDYGGYTEWKRPQQSPTPIDFVICGVAWGKNKNDTYDKNLPEIRKEKRLMTYGFYNGTHDWLAQAETWLRLSQEAGSKAIWMDWERSSKSVLAENSQGHALRAKSIINYLQNEFEGKVGIYSNFNDYVVYLQPHVDARDWPWWVAWPDENPDTPPGSSTWWSKINREPGDYTIDQYSWKGYAPYYGVTNEKKSIDLNVVNPNVNLDVFLGIEDEPEEPTGPSDDYKQGWNDALDKIKGDAEEAKRA